MTEHAELLAIGLSTGLSGAMIPGPLMLFTISEAFRSGQLAGIKIALGHLLLEGIFAALVLFGLRDVLTAPAIHRTVVWVGAAGLMVMGGLILLNVRRLSLTQTSCVVFGGGPVWGGAFFSVTSPGFLLWWTTIGAAVLLQGSLAGPGGVAMVSLGHILADVGWCWFVAFSVERGKTYCTDRAYRLIMAAMALGLIGLAIRLPLAL